MPLTEMEQPLKQGKVMLLLQELGYKILLHTYECPLGTVDMIAKKDGYIVFIGVDRQITSLRRVARYYVKRYGLMMGIKQRIVLL